MPAPLTAPRAAGALVAGSAAGWVIENTLDGPRYSAVLGGAQTGVPLLPVYGAGTVLVMALAPALQSLPALARGAVYAGMLTWLEFAACKAERARGQVSWSYGTEGACVDLPHTVAWGMLGLVAEQVALRVGSKPRRKRKSVRPLR